MKNTAILLLVLFAPVLRGINIGYSIKLEQYKESSKLLNSISLTHQLTSRITMNADASFSAQKNQDLQRFLDSRNGSATISFRPTSEIEFGINLSRNISTEERYGSIIRDQLNNTTSGQIRYTPTSWLSVDMQLGAHFVDYMNPSGDTTITGHDQGGVTNVNVSLNSSLFNVLNGSLSFGENRTLGHNTDSGRDNLTARLNYGFPEIFNGGNLSVQAGASRQFTIYHDSTRSLRQDDWSNNISLVVPTPYKYLSMEITTGWDFSDRYWEDENPDSSSSEGDVRDRLERGRNISSSIRYQILNDLLLNMTVSRGIRRNDRKRTAAGVSTIFNVYDISDDRAFTSSLQYTPGDNRITFERLIQLYRYDTFGTWTDVWGTVHKDNNDRDELREVLALSAEIPVSNRIILEASIQGQNRKTVYLMAEQSGNSKVSSTYSINPGFRFDAGGDWTLRESVKISADYTTFLFPEYSSSSTDLLFRRLVTRTSFQRVAQDSTTLGISHIFRFQDQGSLVSSVFNRSEEIISNTIKLNLGFHISGSIGLTPNYAWEYSRRNYVASGSPSLIEHLHHVGLRTRMNLADGTLDLRVTRTFYSRKDRQSYWRAEVGLNYQF